MTRRQQETVLCQVCKEQKKISEVLSAEMIREPIVKRIKATHRYCDSYWNLLRSSSLKKV